MRADLSRPAIEGVLRGLAVVAAVVLASCSGETSDPQPQAPAPRTEVSGTVTDGVSLRVQSVSLLGNDGPTRQTTTSTTGAYTLTLTELSPPYLLTNTLSPDGDPGLIVLTTLATKAGTVNVNPLTTLLTAQLLGLNPGTVINSYGTGAGVAKNRITDAGIRAAQADLTAFLQDVVGVQVKSGSASFTDSSFEPAAGDAMFDTILALNAKLAADGTTLKDLSTRIATGVHACDVEQMQITINGARKKFCPTSKGAVPEEAEPAILDYTFQTIANEMLTVKARDATVLSIGFVSATGATHSCTGAACSTATLGAIADDESRPLNFASVALTGSSGTASLDGTLVGSPPSITLPTLPCSENRYFLILSNHTVLADCIQSGDPFNLGGNFSTPNQPGRERVYFGPISVVLDTSGADPTVTSAYFTNSDPDTQETRRYLCRGAACNGVTVGAATNTTVQGFPIEIRTVTFNNTLMTGLDEDGGETGLTGSLRASFVLLRTSISQPSVYPPLADCDPTQDTVSATAFDGSEFNLCMPPNDPAIPFLLYRQTFDFGDGSMELFLNNDFSDHIAIFMRDGAITRVEVQISTSSEQFECTTDCAGITVSAPNGAGERTVSFSNAVLHYVEVFPLPGDRTLTLTSGDLVVPPP